MSKLYYLELALDLIQDIFKSPPEETIPHSPTSILDEDESHYFLPDVVDKVMTRLRSCKTESGVEGVVSSIEDPEVAWAIASELSELLSDAEEAKEQEQDDYEEAIARKIEALEEKSLRGLKSESPKRKHWGTKKPQ